MNILIVAGGSSAERQISLQSGQAVYDALKDHHEVELYDPVDNDVLIQKARQADAVLIMLHGRGGEDGVIQRLLEEHLVHHYLGSDPKSSALAFDKWAFKQTIEASGILTPKAEIVTRASFVQSPLVRRPFVLKPVDDGSSVDTHIVRNPPEQLDDYLEVFDRHEQMLLEELIQGVEITVAILGEEVLPPVEIHPPDGQEFDYKNKYNGASRELCPPPSLDDVTIKAAQDLVLRIHQLIGCRDLSRTDMIVAGDGQIYVLELNTLPGMTSQSLLPLAAKTAGLSYEQLAEKLVVLAAAN